ncbi:MAG TPA: phosphohydrolase, partial [Candidatus Atribacteria bacterium]|nr:phosphohydrolase [Candidatus Atribacteria bacterium]
ADTFAAMTSDRAYRKGLSKKMAIEELKRVAGTQLDPEIVKVFIEKVMSKGGK